MMIGRRSIAALGGLLLGGMMLGGAALEGVAPGNVALAAPIPAAVAEPDRGWAFPGRGAPLPPPKDQTPRHLAGSSQAFTPQALADLAHVVDWFPDRHPPLPPVVAAGRNGAPACGFCHLADGQGRPENAGLAGLPAEYIQRQVAAFASGARTAGQNGWVPSTLMAQIAKSADPADIAEAARYYSQRPFVSHVRVVESALVPDTVVSRFSWLQTGKPAVPLGSRILEMPASMEGFEMRDPDMRYTAYVPLGAIARGATLAASGGPMGMACTACHGAGLRGAMGPPLAGRSPSAIARQLIAFHGGQRADPEGSVMRHIAAKLSDDQMIALAAYAASLNP